MTQDGRDRQLSGTTCMTTIMQGKLRYLTELRCRELEVAFSTYINAAIDVSLKDVDSGSYVNETLWHDDPAIRLYRLASNRPDLLSQHERVLWRSILKDQRVCDAHGRLDPDEISKQWQRLIVGF